MKMFREPLLLNNIRDSEGWLTCPSISDLFVCLFLSQPPIWQHAFWLTAKDIALVELMVLSLWKDLKCYANTSTTSVVPIFSQWLLYLDWFAGIILFLNEAMLRGVTTDVSHCVHTHTHASVRAHTHTHTHTRTHTHPHGGLNNRADFYSSMWCSSLWLI